MHKNRQVNTTSIPIKNNNTTTKLLVSDNRYKLAANALQQA